MATDPAQREKIVAIAAGVADLHAHPAFGHLRLEPLADLQRRKWIVGSGVRGVNCEHLCSPPFAASRRSWDDFQRGDLVAVESEKEPKIHGATRKVAGEPAGDDEPSVLLFARQGLARVLVPGRGIRLPLLDC